MIISILMMQRCIISNAQIKKKGLCFYFVDLSMIIHNTSLMVGINNGVYSKLKKNVFFIYPFLM